MVPKIIGNMQQMPIPLKNHFSVPNKFKLADTLTQQIELSTTGIYLVVTITTKSCCKRRLRFKEDCTLSIHNLTGLWLEERKSKKMRKERVSCSRWFKHQAKLYPKFQHFIKTNNLIPIQINTEDLWKLEAIGIIPTDETKQDDKLVMEHYENTFEKVDGIY